MSNICDNFDEDLNFDDLFENTNPGLFKNHKGGSIRFHIISQNKTVKTKYEALIVLYGGRTVREKDVSSKTAILVDGLTKYACEKVTFKVSYVLDCIKKNTLLELSPYILGYHNISSRKSYLDVLFWAKEDFPNIESVSKNTNFPNEQFVSDDSDIEPSVTSKSSTFKKTRAPYTVSEKESILKFIITKNKFASLRGDNIWKTMECRNICPRRTYQSMKEHFWKILRHELNRFSFLTEAQKYALVNNTALNKK